MRIRFFLLVITLYISNVSIGQEGLPSDLSNVRAAQISDPQIIQLLKQLKSSGYTENDLYNLAIARGMSSIEAQALKTRADTLSPKVEPEVSPRNSSAIEKNISRTTDRTQTDSTIEVDNKLQIFGAELFNKSNLTFEPNLRMATPKNYTLGPDDEIVIDVFGYQEANHRLKITPDGNINVPYVGIIYVNGLTFEQATNRIIEKLTKNGYSNISNGRTKVQISLGSIRSIKVALLGEVRKPGTYTLPSLATVFNALYASGGPTVNGSFRNIQIIRENKIIDTLDIYDFLMKGDQTHNVRLMDQDIIRIPPYTTRLTIKGEVKRQGIYEIRTNEHFSDALQFAGGFSDGAYAASASVIQSTSTQKRVVDITAEQFSSYVPHNADICTIGKILERYENRVRIEGAVFRPGIYEWKPGLTLLQLIERAQGLKEDAFVKRGIIARLKPDLTPSFLNFNITNIISQKEPDIILQKEDSITIKSIFDLKGKSTVSIEGEVRIPNRYNYYDGMTLQDLILIAGGFTEQAYSSSIEIARRIKDANPLNLNTPITSIIKIDTAGDIFDMQIPMVLEPFDKIIVHTNPSYLKQKGVRIEGAVLYPGEYALSTQVDRVSTLLRRAGGLLPTANPDAVYILRLCNAVEISKRKQQILASISNKRDSISNNPIDNSIYDRLILDLNSITKRPGSTQDALLMEGDILQVDKLTPTVKVSGMVYNPSIQPYIEGKSLKGYINNAGGMIVNSTRKRDIHIIYPNGEAHKISKFLFFTFYPKVRPGSEIVVPKVITTEKKSLSTTEIVGISSAIASLAAVVTALINNLK